jgi:hypothetical protein
VLLDVNLATRTVNRIIPFKGVELSAAIAPWAP